MRLKRSRRTNPCLRASTESFLTESLEGYLAGRAELRSAVTEKAKMDRTAELRSAGFGFNGAKAVYPGGKTTSRKLAVQTAFKKQKRHTAKNEDGRGRGESRETRREWILGECSLHRGLVSSVAAGPGLHRRSGFWQETTFWGRVSERTSPPVGPQHRHCPTPNRLKGETVQT